jgi:ABC-type antimicrobial peptide transport system permease subunit
MKPLSSINFIKGNIKKVLPPVITMAMAVIIIYLISLFFVHIENQIYSAHLYPFKNMTLLFGDKKTINEESISDIKNKFRNDLFFADNSFVSYNMLSAYTSSFLLYVDFDSLDKIMKYQNIKIKRGELPKTDNEILIHKDIAINYNLNIGDTVIKNKKGWMTDKDLIVTGIYSGKPILTFGILDKNQKSYEGLIVFGNRESLKDINKYLEKNYSDTYFVWTESSSIELLKPTFTNFNMLKSLVSIIIIIVIGFVLYNITSIQYSIRNKELELLYAIGYSRKKIILKSIIEFSYTSLIAYLAGILFTSVIVFLVNMYLLESDMIKIPVYDLKSILNVTVVPIIFILLNIIIPVKYTRFRLIA